MRKKISILLCCAAVIGLFSVSAAPAEAATCSHPYYYTNMGAVKWDINSSQHQKWTGTQWVCTTCGYTFWKDLVPEKPQNHEYQIRGTDIDGNILYYDKCSVCGYTR